MSNTPSSVFRYHAAADQYIYNADISKLPVGSCRRFKVKLVSPTPLYPGQFLYSVGRSSRVAACFRGMRRV